MANTAHRPQDSAMAPQSKTPPPPKTSMRMPPTEALAVGQDSALGMSSQHHDAALAAPPLPLPPQPPSPCPAHIAAYISSAASLLPGYSGAVVTDAVELNSAQQFVCIVTVREGQSAATTAADGVESDNNDAEPQATPPPGREPKQREAEVAAALPGSHRLHEALRTGRNRLVVRVWKGSARWWNLNVNHNHIGGGGGTAGGGCAVCDDEIVNMARSEVAGYRVARASLCRSSITTTCNPVRRSGGLIIPEVLYFSHDYCNDDVGWGQAAMAGNGGRQQRYPWAIFSYVGEGSMHFSEEEEEEWTYDGLYARDMVKVRHEFGYDEPHPRHGRVEAGQSLDYAMEVLEGVVLPLQDAFFSVQSSGGFVEGLRGRDLCALGRLDCDTSAGGESARPYRYHDMIAIYERSVSQMTEASQRQEDGTRVRILIGTLKQCIQRLSAEADGHAVLSSNAMPPVLCHLDLQPQNMVLRRRNRMQQQRNLTAENAPSVPQISSVLDWEEACYADPRFEVLLLGRKVCANRDQADELWAHYSRHVRANHGGLEVGPIEPWLKLETVHSITTLVMQGMDLVGGGRNPWEGMPDLSGKIEREFCRLVHLDWDFCERAVQR